MMWVLHRLISCANQYYYNSSRWIPPSKQTKCISDNLLLKIYKTDIKSFSSLSLIDYYQQWQGRRKYTGPGKMKEPNTSPGRNSRGCISKDRQTNFDNRYPVCLIRVCVILCDRFGLNVVKRRLPVSTHTSVERRSCVPKAAMNLRKTEQLENMLMYTVALESTTWALG